MYANRHNLIEDRSRKLPSFKLRGISVLPSCVFRVYHHEALVAVPLISQQTAVFPTAKMRWRKRQLHLRNQRHNASGCGRRSLLRVWFP